MSIYFIITTFSTVGYGDISLNNAYEWTFCTVIMLFGVFAFAVGTGTMTGIINESDI